MDEYIDRGIAIAKLTALEVTERNATMTSAKRLLAYMPAADVAPVVRCKGCKHSTLPSELTQRYGVPGTLTCHNRHSPCNRRNVGGDDFCSYGERKDDADAEG